MYKDFSTSYFWNCGKVDAKDNNCDAPKSGGPLINHQFAENLWILHNSIPYCVSHSQRSIILQEKKGGGGGGGGTKPPFVVGALPKTILHNVYYGRKMTHGSCSRFT